ncbi:MAG: nucleotidyltransferase domain-containing protein [Aquificae bacterium]|nr:nucleotidyltransferase domain-containing protein [Aquificota bacterium]
MAGLNGLGKNIKSLINQTLNILKEEINQPFKVYLIGSLAEGRETPSSDIDLVVETERMVSHRDFRKIKNRVDNIKTLRKVDLIYFNTSSDRFKKGVKNGGILVYEFKIQD